MSRIPTEDVLAKWERDAQNLPYAMWKDPFFALIEEVRRQRATLAVKERAFAALQQDGLRLERIENAARELLIHCAPSCGVHTNRLRDALLVAEKSDPESQKGVHPDA